MINAIFENIENEIISQIESSTKSIKLAVSWFTNARIFDSLLVKLKKNIDVELVINDNEINNNSNSYDYNKLIKSGCKLYFVNKKYFMHHKFMIIDEIVLVTGSYNFTEQAEKVNRENVLVIKGNPGIIKMYIKELERILSFSEEVFDFKRKNVKCNNQNSFIKFPESNEIHPDSEKDNIFTVENVYLDKKYLEIKGKCKEYEDQAYFINTDCLVQEIFEIGDILHLKTPFEIEELLITKKGFFKRIDKWIVYPILIDEVSS